MDNPRPTFAKPKQSSVELAGITQEELAQYLMEIARQEPEIANFLLAEPAPSDKPKLRGSRRVTRP